MPSICINTCYGGFGLSNEATELYMTKTGRVPFYSDTRHGCTTYATTPFVDNRASEGTYFFDSYIKRDDPILIEIVEQLGDKANGSCAELKIIQVPTGVDWEIHDYDGMKSVREKSRSWS